MTKDMPTTVEVLVDGEWQYACVLSELSVQFTAALDDDRVVYKFYADKD